MSGAVHFPLPGFLVYGQYGLYPGKFGGRIWQVGTASFGPPAILTSAFRSVAKLTPCRAFKLLKGGSLTLNAKYQVDVSGFTCTLLAYFAELSSPSRSAG